MNISNIKFKNFFAVKKNLLLILIILLGLTLRLYQIKELFFYTMDEEVMNLIQRNIVLGKHFPLIGSVSAISTYLGPIFYYFGAAILFLSNLNPLGQGIFSAILGSINIFLIYKVTKDLFNSKTGLIASFLYSTSFLMTIFDRRYWHLTPGPFISLIVLWSLYKIKNGSIKFIYPLILALIFGWNTDYTNLILFVFVAVSWIIFKLPWKRKEVLFAIVLFLISNIPLLIFDLRHDFLNTKAIINYPSHKRLEAAKKIQNLDREPLAVTWDDQVQIAMLPFITFSRLIYTVSDLNIAEQHTYCKPYIQSRNKAQGLILPLLAFFVILFFIYLVIKMRKTKNCLGLKMVGLFYLIFQLGILFYAILLKGDFFEHYLATLLPTFFIILAVVITYFYNSKFRLIFVLFLLIFAVLNINLTLKAYNPFGYQNKINATRFALEQIGNEDFSLDSLSNCFRWDGFYYPFILLGKHPVKSYQDPNYAWLFDYKVLENQPKRVVVMVPKGRFENAKFYDDYLRYQKWVVAKKSFGAIEVLILDNSRGDFK